MTASSSFPGLHHELGQRLIHINDTATVCEQAAGGAAS